MLNLDTLQISDIFLISSKMKSISKKTLRYIILLLIGLLGIVLIMLKAPSYLPSQPLPGMTHIAPSIEPSWLTVIYPEQNQAVVLADYTASRNDPSPVCVRIAPDIAMRKPEYSWTASDAVERTVILVDGIQRYKLPTSWVGDLMMSAGPYFFCVYAPVTPGIHKVDASFRTDSGMTPIFSWTFEVFGIAVPASTQLPTPAVIDHQNHLPLFLREVYPSPGQTVSLAKYINITPEGKKLWEDILFTDSELFQQGVERLSHGAVCFALRMDEVRKLGILPSEEVDWPSRVYLQVDGNILTDWAREYSLRSVDSDSLQVNCQPVSLGIGEHTVSFYIHPYNADLTSYSWEFTVTK